MKQLILSLTLFRIIAGPIIFLLAVFFEAYLTSFFIFIIASITDYLDGSLSRKYNLTSKMGAVLDPIADKILVTFMFLVIALHINNAFISLFIALILAREFWVSGLREMNSINQNPQSTQVSWLAKVKTTLQMTCIGLYLWGFAFHYALVIFISHFILFLVLLITIRTGLDYTLESYNQYSKHDK